MAIIKVENLGKRYQLGELHSNLMSERIGNGLRKLVGTFRPLSQQSDNSPKSPADFWALKDVSFEVSSGEVVGIIGKNGAGKSTLLKVLSRITAPTTGQVEMSGRVASLLEVGTGFHPELTGRENIYLNGAILGMSKADVRKKFDEIVAFAELDKFIDTPVKRYSSGMYVRLAFAVAAHLEPEILLIDEVLAVGDAEFQSKCIGKMKDVAGAGRTVLFVSHNMNAVRELCSRAICLKNASVALNGDVNEVINSYLDISSQEGADKNLENVIDESCRSITGVTIRDDRGNKISQVGHDEQFVVEVSYRAPSKGTNYIVAVRLTDSMGNVLFTSWNRDWLRDSASIKGSNYLERCVIPGNFFKPGRYIVTTFVREQSHGSVGNIEELELPLEITEQGYRQGRGRLGLIAPHLEWQSEKLQ